VGALTAPRPTPGRERAREFSERCQIEAAPGEAAILLEGDVGLVPLGGDAA
jgi:hypothetical protein